MRCAKCKSTDVQKFENAMRGFCTACNSVVEIEYEDTQEKQSMQVFFSYGHDTHQDFVRRLANAIMRKTDGRIKVWIDNEDIHEHTNWRERITDGILNSRSVLAFLSQYSAREKGVCLDELAIA
ncbi:MAG: toll/interleukin-1 receptor domain-containing protein, partial [Clostridia bacterium]|nr:toll/interleukin-1 receptor domain-containing protein [Clostridia bacterium]